MTPRRLSRCAIIHDTRRLVVLWFFGDVLTSFSAGLDGVEAQGAGATEAATESNPAENSRPPTSPARSISSQRSSSMRSTNRNISLSLRSTSSARSIGSSSLRFCRNSFFAASLTFSQVNNRSQGLAGLSYFFRTLPPIRSLLLIRP